CPSGAVVGRPGPSCHCSWPPWTRGPRRPVSSSSARPPTSTGRATPPDPAGTGGGSLPPTVAVGGGRTLTFPVTGLVSYNGGGNFYGADGGVFGPTLIDPYGGLSGIQDDTRRFFLAGVFLSDQEPGGAPPPTLHFTDDGFVALAPALDQVFLIG